MDDLQLIVDLHLFADRQGPGSDAMTRRAIELAGLRDRGSLRIADIGCGTGASTLVLAAELDAEIVAVDFLPAFLERLQARAGAAGVADRVRTEEAAMEALPFLPGSLDVIWSEGAIYNMGFERGVREWRRFLKPGGIVAVSELTWLTEDRPAALDTHWLAEYPEVDTAAAKLAILERNGYAPLAYFSLPESCWLDAYYRPMQARFADYLQAHGGSEAAKSVVAAEVREIALYECHRDYYSYGFYIARKIGQR